jgi:hypothetical protein
MCLSRRGESDGRQVRACWVGWLFVSEETQLSRNHKRNKPAESPWLQDRQIA